MRMLIATMTAGTGHLEAAADICRAVTERLIPIRVQDETKARRIPVCWQGASQAHIRMDAQRASKQASSPEDKRMSLILNANGN